MEAGNDHLDDLVALFDPDATYTEPFTDRGATHTGRDAIRAYMKESGAAVPPGSHSRSHRGANRPTEGPRRMEPPLPAFLGPLSDATAARSVMASSSASEPNSYNTPSRATSTD